MYGKDPLLPGHFTGLPGDTFYEPCTQQVTAALEAMKEYQKTQGETVRKELAEMNREIK